jgi:hypothetical protein
MPTYAECVRRQHWDQEPLSVCPLCIIRSTPPPHAPLTHPPNSRCRFCVFPAVTYAIAGRNAQCFSTRPPPPLLLLPAAASAAVAAAAAGAGVLTAAVSTAQSTSSVSPISNPDPGPPGPPAVKLPVKQLSCSADRSRWGPQDAVHFRVNFPAAAAAVAATAADADADDDRPPLQLLLGASEGPNSRMSTAGSLPPAPRSPGPVSLNTSLHCCGGKSPAAGRGGVAISQ